MTNRLSQEDQESLYAIAERHGTDKAGPARRFLWVYQAHLAPLRDKAISLLEIGVFGGASLRMWRDYFPGGRIFGIDVNPSAWHHADERIEIFIGDQTDTDFLDSVVRLTGPLDVVVDDGGHEAAQQITTLLHLWPRLKPGGMYAVEDIHTSYLPQYGMGWRQAGSTVEFLKDVADDVNTQWHNQPLVLGDVDSIAFHEYVCVIRKSRVEVASSSN
jgi:predicted O-methyltransferase YrrM